MEELGQKRIKVLICGGRDFNDYRFFDEWMTWWYSTRCENTALTIISGKASGADSLALGWAKYINALVEEYPANWGKYNKQAGPIRNVYMLTEGKPDIVIAFPGGKGTKHMVDISKKAGVLVEEVVYPPRLSEAEITPLRG